MRYEQVVDKIIQENGVELSTMMKTPCLGAAVGQNP